MVLIDANIYSDTDSFLTLRLLPRVKLILKLCGSQVDFYALTDIPSHSRLDCGGVFGS